MSMVTGVTPLLAFTGWEVRLPMDLMVGLPQGQEQPIASPTGYCERMKKMYDYIRKMGEAVI